MPKLPHPRILTFVSTLDLSRGSRFSSDEICELRDETIFHIELLVDEYREAGLDTEAAITAALADFGPCEWVTSNPPTLEPANKPFNWKSVCAALAWFGFASASCICLIEVGLKLPGNSFMLDIWPSVALVMPFLAGLGVARTRRWPDVRPILLVVGVVAAHTASVILLDPAVQELRTLLLMQLIAWPLIGWGIVNTVSMKRRKQRTPEFAR